MEAFFFPDGVQNAHKFCHQIIPYSENRMYLGISYPHNDV